MTQITFSELSERDLITLAIAIEEADPHNLPEFYRPFTS